MSDLLVRGGQVLDVRTGTYAPDTDIRIENGSIVDTGRDLIAPDDVPRLDARGRTVIPGLIDCHVHVLAATADLAETGSMPASYLANRASVIMSSMLRRGFTTVRDVAGGDFGLSRAQAEGLITGPRLVFGGRALSQTGGHGDDRQPGVAVHHACPCALTLSRIADGVSEVRRAARDELRTGAHHLKVMASGGIASPTDRVDSVQYSSEELDAIVREATAAGRYVTAHAYTSAAVAHALRAGVRCIEHGNLIDDPTIEDLVDHDAWLVPTLITYRAAAEQGARVGAPAHLLAKLPEVADAGLSALERAFRAGVNIAYGTDLLGPMHGEQNREFLLRAEAVPPIEVLRQATVYAAALLGRSGELGELSVGARADLLLLDGDPAVSAQVLANPAAHLHAVVQHGTVIPGTLRHP